VTNAREATEALTKANLAEGVMLQVENKEGTKVTAIKSGPAR
jgi:hypothetical protein